MIQKDFLENVAKVLSDTGIFVIKTDDDAYAEWIREHMDSSGLFEYQISSDEDPEKRSNPQNATEFETIWRSQ